MTGGGGPEPETGKGLQETWAPDSICWGCGPANPHGLHLASYPAEGHVIAEWTPDPHHAAFPGVLNGGIIGTLLDCHCNWAAAHHFMRERAADRPPVTVTAEYTIRLRRPTPTDQPVHLRARVVEADERRATVEAELSSGDVVTATCSGTFVAIGEGHPAHDSW